MNLEKLFWPIFPTAEKLKRALDVTKNMGTMEEV